MGIWITYNIDFCFIMESRGLRQARLNVLKHPQTPFPCLLWDSNPLRIKHGLEDHTDITVGIGLLKH